MTHISVKKLEGDTWMVWNSLHYRAAGPRCAILADALCAHQIAPRYCSHRWRTHVIYIQRFFVSRLVIKILNHWLLMIAQKVEEIRDSPSKIYKNKQKRKISRIKTATKGNSKFSTQLLGQIFWINCLPFPRDFFRSAKNFSSLWIQNECKTSSERLNDIYIKLCTYKTSYPVVCCNTYINVDVKFMVKSIHITSIYTYLKVVVNKKPYQKSFTTNL